MSNVIRVPHLIYREAVANYEAVCMRAAQTLERRTKGEMTGYCMAAHTSLSPLDVLDSLCAYAEDLPCG